MTNKEIGCTQCPYVGHFVLKECPDAYTEVSRYCGLYNHEPMRVSYLHQDSITKSDTQI